MPSCLDATVVERSAAMGAARMNQPGAALAVAKQDQVLAEHAHLSRHAAGVGREPDRMPVATQQLAHRRAGADLGQLAVVRRRREAVGGALIRSLRLRSGSLDVVDPRRRVLRERRREFLGRVAERRLALVDHLRQHVGQGGSRRRSPSAGDRRSPSAFPPAHTRRPRSAARSRSGPARRRSARRASPPSAPGRSCRAP